MDFIERLWHLSPDGGTGTFELLLLLIPLAIALVLWRRPATAGARGSGDQFTRRDAGACAHGISRHKWP